MSRSLHSWIGIRKERKKVKRKLLNLILYLIDTTPPEWKNEPDFKAAIMFLAMKCDFEYYRRHGRSITGAKWVKGASYPIPIYPR